MRQVSTLVLPAPGPATTRATDRGGRDTAESWEGFRPWRCAHHLLLPPGPAGSDADAAADADAEAEAGSAAAKSGGRGPGPGPGPGPGRFRTARGSGGGGASGWATSGLLQRRRATSGEAGSSSIW